MTLSYDLELERKGIQGGLAAADRGKTVDDGGWHATDTVAIAIAFRVSRFASRVPRLAEYFGHNSSLHTLIVVACNLDTAFVPIPGHLRVAHPNIAVYGILAGLLVIFCETTYFSYSTAWSRFA